MVEVDRQGAFVRQGEAAGAGFERRRADFHVDGVLVDLGPGFHAQAGEHVADRRAHGLGVGVALLAVLGHAGGDDRLGAVGDRGAFLAHVGHRGGAVFMQDLLQFAVVGGVAGEAEEEHGAEGVDVAADVEGGVGEDLFRGHVEGAADDRALHGEHGAVLLGRARDAEVGEFGGAVGADEDVRRLDVAVDELDAVGLGEAVDDLVEDGKGERFGQPGARLDHVAQVAAVDVFQDHEQAAVGGDAVVQAAHHVGVAELLRDAGFAFEAAHVFGGLGAVLGAGEVAFEGLDHHRGAVRGGGEPHRAHAAVGEVGEGDVGAEGRGVLGREEFLEFFREVAREAVAGGEPGAQVVEGGDAFLRRVFAQALAGALGQDPAFPRGLDQGVDDGALVDGHACGKSGRGPGTARDPTQSIRNDSTVCNTKFRLAGRVFRRLH